MKNATSERRENPPMSSKKVGNWSRAVQCSVGQRQGYGKEFKVEKILEGSLDLIPSPLLSVKIQIMCGQVGLRYKGKNKKQKIQMFKCSKLLESALLASC